MSPVDEAAALVTAVQSWAERADTPVLLVIGTEPPTVLECGGPAARARLRALVLSLPEEGEPDEHS